MSPITAWPSPQGSRQLLQQSPHVFDFRASDLAGQSGRMQLRSGHSLLFERDSTALATDSKGTLYVVPANYPAWTVVGGRTTLPVAPGDACVIRGIPVRVRSETGVTTWIEDGTVGEENARIAERSNADGDAPRFSLRANDSGAYVAEFVSATQTSAAVLPVAPTEDQRARVWWQVRVSEGSLTVAAWIQIEGGAWSSEVVGSAITAPSEYSGDRWHLGAAHSTSEDA